MVNQIKKHFIKIPFVSLFFTLYNSQIYQKRRKIFVNKIIPKNTVGAELGVLKGNFSPILLRQTNAVKLHLIDPWYFLTGQWEWAKGNKSTVDAVRRILQRFKKEIETGRVLVHIDDDIKVLQQFPDQYFDWVYIDTSHAYEHTKEELKILSKKVKRNGVIAGDDWQEDSNHMHHGVYKAVNEFIVSQRYELIYSNNVDKQWAIKQY